MMKLSKAFIAWTSPYENLSTAGMVEIREADDGVPVWSWDYDCTGGAADMRWRRLNSKDGLQRLLYEMNAMVEIWKLDPRVVHEACMGIDEYAKAKNVHIYKHRRKTKNRTSRYN